MNLTPVARLSVSDAAYAQLRDEILAGRLAPGDPLPSERSLTELLSVNRQAVREALKRLDQAGLVEISHGGTTKVRDYRTSAGLDLLPELLLRGGAIDVTVARSVMEMRACIGPDAARLCAGRALPGMVDQIHAIVDDMAAAEMVDDLLHLAQLDWEFWALIIDGADNIAYRLAFNSLREGAEPLNELLAPVRGDELRAIDTHRALADAIAAGHADEAEAAARSLLAAGTAGVSLALAGDEPDRIASAAKRASTAKTTSTKGARR